MKLELFSRYLAAHTAKAYCTEMQAARVWARFAKIAQMDDLFGNLQGEGLAQAFFAMAAYMRGDIERPEFYHGPELRDV